MRGFATGVGVEADIGAPPLTRLSFMRDTTWADAFRKTTGFPRKAGDGSGSDGKARPEPMA